MELQQEQEIAGARFHFTAESYIEALRSLQIISSQPVTEYTKENHDYLEYEIFRALGTRSVNSDSKITFLLASMSSASEIKRYFAYYAQALFDLAEASHSLFYYKKASTKARKALRFLDLSDDYKRKMVYIIQKSRFKIKNHLNTASMPRNFQQEAKEWNGNEELNAYWEGLTIPFKKNFMKLSVQELKNYLNGDQQTLIEVLKTVKKRKNWKVWICRSCAQKFSTSEACHCHIEEEHIAEIKPSLRESICYIKQVWADSISVGGWEPVDAVGCVQIIKNRFEDVKAFVYKDGWCKDWSVARDIERSRLLKEIRLLLLSLIKQKVLSDSFIDWVMHLVVKQLEKLDVPKEMIIDCHLEETPQSICFLESDELRAVLEFLRKIKSKCTRVDVKDIVCRTVDSFCQSTRVNERIDFDSQFSFLLLDKRLLQGTVDLLDDEGTVKICDPARHCASVHPRGDYLVTWLNDYFTGDGDDFEFPEPIHNHNFDIWMAVLRAVQFTSRTMGTKYAMKSQLLEYATALTEAREVYQTEGKASLIYDGSTKVFLCAVLDGLRGGKTFPAACDVLEAKILQIIRNQSETDEFLSSIDNILHMLKEKVALLDSKILLCLTQRGDLLNDLTRVAFFDYRYYLLPPVKDFLLSTLWRMFHENASL